jgi:PhnB protein
LRNDEFWGDTLSESLRERHAAVKDPTGDCWWIATHKEDVSCEEMEQRIQALFDSKEATVA